MSDITLRGWRCRACGVFNGEEKDTRNECRCCGRTKGSEVKTLEEAIKHFEERRELCLKTATLSPDVGVKVSSSARAETYLYVNLILGPLLQKQAVDELTQQAEANGEYTDVAHPDDLYVNQTGKDH